MPQSREENADQQGGQDGHPAGRAAEAGSRDSPAIVRGAGWC